MADKPLKGCSDCAIRNGDGYILYREGTVLRHTFARTRRECWQALILVSIVSAQQAKKDGWKTVQVKVDFR